MSFLARGGEVVDGKIPEVTDMAIVPVDWKQAYEIVSANYIREAGELDREIERLTREVERLREHNKELIWQDSVELRAANAELEHLREQPWWNSKSPWEA